jgi:hypothetical protein
MNIITMNERKRNVLASFVYRNHHEFQGILQDFKSVTFVKNVV